MWLEDKHFCDLIKNWWNGYDVSGRASFRSSSKLKLSIKDKIKSNLGHVECLQANLLEEMQALNIKEESHMICYTDIAKRFNLKDIFERRVR